MLPTKLREAMFNMSQRPKQEHLNERFSDKRDRSEYWKERWSNVMKPRMPKK